MFKIWKLNAGSLPVIKELPSASATFSVGEVAVIASGVVTKTSGTAKPTHVICEKGTKTTANVVAVNPIYEDMEFLTTFYGDGSSLNIGDKVTIHTDSAQVTATTTNGVATIVEKLGSGASGTEVIVKFA